MAEQPSTQSKSVDPPLWHIAGRAYDLTPWLDKHPGGSLILEQTQGSDCTALFYSYHTFTKFDITRHLSRFYVRDSTASESSDSAMFNWSHTPKWDAARARIREHFKDRSPKAPPIVLAWYCFWCFIFISQGYQWLATGDTLTGVLFGLSIWFFSGDLLHMCTHFAVFASPKANLLTGYLSGCLHANPSAWIRQHVIGHHAYTNMDGKDPDLYHFEVLHFWLGIIGFRLSETSVYKESYKHWRALCVICMVLTGIGPLIIESVDFLVSSKYLSFWVADQRSPIPIRERIGASIQWVAVVMAFAFVWRAHGAWAAWVPFAVHGVIYYAFSQVSHANSASQLSADEAAFETTVHPVEAAFHGLGGVTNAHRRRLEVSGEQSEKSNEAKGEWVVHQWRTSLGDYAGDSVFWAFVSNGLNLQSVHHLFPNVHWWHYRKMYGVLSEALGQPMTATERSFGQALGDHFSFIAELNDATKEL